MQPPTGSQALLMPTTAPLHPWLIRLLLAVLLALGSEVLLWTDPPARPLVQWPLLFFGYGVIATVLLDLMVRFNVRDLSGLMLTAGIYSLLSALLLNPKTTLYDVPFTFVSRVSGAHSLLGLEMLFVFMALTGGHRRYLWRVNLVGGVVVGAAWGTWVRYAPAFLERVHAPVELSVMLLWGLLGIAATALITAIIYRRVHRIQPVDMQLSVEQWAVMSVILAGLGFVRIAQGALGPSALLLSVIILFITVMIQWFRRSTTLPTILDGHLPVLPMRWPRIALLVGVLLWTATLTYALPIVGTETVNQLNFIVSGFTLYGLAWLPSVSLLLGVRAYIRQVQARD